MNERWAKPVGAELDENIAAQKRMRVIVSVLAALFGCVLIGVFLWIGG